MSLETASWKGATVPILHPGSVKRSYSLTDYLQWQQAAWTAGGNQYPTMATGFMTTQNGQPAEPIGNSFIGYVEGLLYQNGPVAAVEAKRIEVFSQAPMLFQAVKDGRPGDMYDDESLDLLRTPWVGGTTSDLLGRSLSYADFGGNAYVVIIDGELVVLRPDYVDIVLEERMHEGGQVGWRQVGIMYREMASGVGVPFLRGQYAHYAPKIDPLATYRGMSWLTPVVREVMADKSAIDHRLAFQSNAATPNLAVSVPQPLTPEQFGEFVEAMDSQHKGSRNAGKTLYTAGGADVTVIGSNMKEMDFTALLGKSETRIANAGGVPPVVVGFSEGLQGSSLNSGNYESAKRAFADTTCRHLWANWCGSMQVLFPPPEPRDRLWYESRDIPFLHEDLKDLSAIEQTQAATISSLITSGFKPESAVAAVRAHDMSLLEHSGMVSVQLAPPGDATGAPADQFATDGTVPPDQAAPDQYIDESAMTGDTAARGLVWALDMVSRGWNPFDHPRNDKGSPGGGRFRSLADRVADAVSGAEAAQADPLKGFSRPQLFTAAKRRGLNPSRGVSIGNLKKMLLDDVQAGREHKAATADAAKQKADQSAAALLARPSHPGKKPVPIAEVLDGTPEEKDAALRAVFEGKFGKLSTKVTQTGGRTGEAWVEGTIHDRLGRTVGRFGRSVKKEENGEVLAHHGLLEIDNRRLQGAGFASEFNGRAIDWYRGSGVDAVLLRANGDVGGYAWASAGFDFQGPSSARHVLNNLRELVADLRSGKSKNQYGEAIGKKLRTASDLSDQLDAAEALLSRADRSKWGQPDFPTAYEISQLGRPEGAGRTDTWVGKYLTLGSSWEAELRLTGGEATDGAAA